MFGAGPSTSTAPDAADPPKLAAITYRHLLSPQTLNVHNPLRVVALIDSDAFYAACEQVRLGLEPSIPLAVQQWRGLIAINYPARKFGITRMMTVTEAKKLCPQLVCVHVMTYQEGTRDPGYWPNAQPTTHKVSLDHYRRESKKVLHVFQSTLPGAEVERASIDEAFFDLSAPVRELILQRYPYLAHVPADAPAGMDSALPAAPAIDWTGLGNVLPVREPGGSADVDDDGGPGAEDERETWADVALAIGAEMVNQVREAVRDQLGYTTSAGIARNKTMAKLCASCQKPFGQTVLRDAAIPAYLWPMPFQKIRFLGGKFGDALASKYDATTIGDLLRVSRAEMQSQFAEDSFWVYNILRGADYAEVKERTGVKSMLASKNVRPSAKTLADGLHWLRVLAAELALRLDEARELTPSLWPRVIVLHIRQGADPQRSRQVPFPYMKDLTDEAVARVGERLLRELVGSGERWGKAVSHIALGFAGLEEGEQGQRGIEAFLGGGSGSGSGSGSGGAAPGAVAREEGERPPAKRRRSSEQDAGRTGRAMGNVQDTSDTLPGLSLSCPRCSKVLTTSVDDEEAQAMQLDALKAEHEDFHFAQDLQKADGDDRNGNGNGAPNRPDRNADTAATGTKKKKRKEKKPEGIAAYFQKR